MVKIEASIEASIFNAIFLTYIYGCATLKCSKKISRSCFFILIFYENMTNLPKKSSGKKYIVSLAILAAFMFVMYQNKNAVYAQMDEWKLIPRSERFTELYFNDHINLPKQISKDDQISFSFVIHNLEGENKEYPYIVYYKSQDGQITNIEEKTVTLADGEYKTIEESYTSTLQENTGGIFVELEQKQQGIDFLLNNNN
jgi:hypothetical protein